jgi:3-oxoacyl-ACP reductase-like protein
MSIFGSIMSGIFGKAPEAKPAEPAVAKTATTPTAPAAGPATTTAASTPTASSAASSASPSAPVDVAAVLSNLAAQNKQKLNWRTSIVDLMKLLDLDSSLSARKQLAQELHFTGDMNDSASMNIWLHKQVMTKLAENGGKVPEELRH